MIDGIQSSSEWRKQLFIEGGNLAVSAGLLNFTIIL